MWSRFLFILQPTLPKLSTSVRTAERFLEASPLRSEHKQKSITLNQQKRKNLLKTSPKWKTINAMKSVDEIHAKNVFCCWVEHERGTREEKGAPKGKLCWFSWFSAVWENKSLLPHFYPPLVRCRAAGNLFCGVYTHKRASFFPFPCLSQSLPTVSHSGKTMMGKELLDDKDSTRSQTISLFVVWRRFMAMSFHPQTGPSSPVGCQSYFQCAVINCVCLFPWTEQENWWFT